MVNATDPDRGRDLREAVTALAATFPVPSPSWHRYVPEMRACLADLRAALAACDGGPEALDLAASAVEGALDSAFDAEHAGPALRDAYRRLGLLPVPAGEHPYLDEIVPTLEALEALLVAISHVPAARAAFARDG